jgi:hypothetical protein
MKISGKTWGRMISRWIIVFLDENEEACVSTAESVT